jgi:hypothetical protein
MKTIYELIGKHISIDVKLGDVSVGVAAYIGDGKWEVHGDPIESSPLVSVCTADEAVVKLLEWHVTELVANERCERRHDALMRQLEKSCHSILKSNASSATEDEDGITDADFVAQIKHMEGK